jgi:hypothetical protein
MTNPTHRRGGRFSTAVLFMQCFNVAAITALGVWNGYLFQSRAPAPLQLIEVVASGAAGTYQRPS